MKKEEVLKKYFGYSSFREGQAELIDSILEGRDVMGVMPTGAGKSICFQVPALMLPGVTIVISPLISLMNDQVSALRLCGVPCAYINGTLSEAEMHKTLQNIKNGKYKIIYIAPERLDTKSFLDACQGIDISLLCVDEAHCVSQWGHDFRPAYLSIKEFERKLEKRPVMCAYTATATQRVREDIKNLIGLKNPVVTVTGFDRENLYFEVLRPKDKLVALRRYLDLFSGRSGIVYCSSRKNVDILTALLDKERYSVTKYHAGLSKAERQRNQDLFIKDSKEVIIATNAFGMGIDKPNVSFVIHYNMPGDIESYYQEAGRAGRDGRDSDCILFYNGIDVRTQRYFIDNPEENETLTEEEKQSLRTMRLEKLEKMIEYATGNVCLRHYMLRYFGERATGKCHSCSVCNGAGVSTDVTTEGQKIFSLIKRTGEKENRQTVLQLLKGVVTDYILEKELDKVKTFGAMNDVAESQILMHIDYFLGSGYIKSDSQGRLKLTEKCRPVLFEGKRIRKLLPKTEAMKQKERSGQEVDIGLYLKLKLLRKELGKKAGVPDYSVFDDSVMKSLAKIKPKSFSEMMSIQGLPERKMQKYGPELIALINRHCATET